MGSGIAQVAATAGYDTILYDLAPAMLQKGRDNIEKNLSALSDKGRISSGEKKSILSRLSFSSDIRTCRADIIIEAIIEDLDVKKNLFLQLAAINGPGIIFTSNTSSLSISHLAGALPDPGRVAGMHFFNPAPVMKLVEVVETTFTSTDTRNTVLEVARRMGKTAVLCRDSPGFIVNHVARPFYLEALRLVEKEQASIGDIDTLLEATGFRMGPFRLMDLIGNDINYAVSCSVYEALGRPGRLKPSPFQEQKVKEGALGRKTGRGYYQYNDARQKNE
jgi:3-hydroxybutyryl-CoA dehydrogenase